MKSSDYEDMNDQHNFFKMSQLRPEPFASDVMRFLEKIEDSFQEAEAFLKESQEILNQKGYGEDLASTLQHVQMARKYVSNLRKNLPKHLDAREDAFIAKLIEERANRRLR